MQSQNIQWFPGHMAKTRRLINENLKNADAVIEILDARIPYSSRNPEIKRICAGKPSVLLLNKASLADPAITAYWIDKYTDENTICIETDCISGQGISKISQALKELCEERISRYEQKGMHGRAIKAMVVGIPNVGKSSLINKIAGSKKAKVEDRPGVTMTKQWVTTDIGLSLLDMPGVLWPKFSDETVGQNLAMTGAIKDQILDVETLAMVLCERLMRVAPDLFLARYKLDRDQCEGLDGYDLLQEVGRKRGFLLSGGVVNERRCAETLLDEFRGAKIGRITLERPE